MKKQKTDKKNTKAGEVEKNVAPGHEEQKKKEEKKDEEAAPKKKAPGRPKGTGSGGAKAKKEPKPRSSEVLARALEAARDAWLDSGSHPGRGTLMNAQNYAVAYELGVCIGKGNDWLDMGRYTSHVICVTNRVFLL